MDIMIFTFEKTLEGRCTAINTVKVPIEENEEDFLRRWMKETKRLDKSISYYNYSTKKLRIFN